MNRVALTAVPIVKIQLGWIFKSCWIGCIPETLNQMGSLNLDESPLLLALPLSEGAGRRIDLE